MTGRRLALVAGLVGLMGGTLALVAWQFAALRLVSVAPVAIDSVHRCGSHQPDPRHARSIANARRQIVNMMRDRRIPGMTATVAVDGRIVWSEGFGYADLERRTPACPDTRFRLASVSKPITAAVMARLADERILDMDATVDRYIPTYRQGTGITPRHLASHRAGIRDYRDDREAFTTTQFRNLRESLVLFQDDPLLFEPDTRHAYSGYGYALLGAALEGASGLEFGALVERVLRPIGMGHTSVDRNDTTLANVTRFYDHVTPYVMDGQVHPSPFVAMSSKWAGGGILSTTDDLARFGSALLPDSHTPLLADSTRKLLFTPRSWLAPPIVGYALGWITMRDIDLRRLYMHFGAGSGATSWLGVFPDERLVVAVLANLGHARFSYAGTIGLASPFMGTRLSAFVVVFAAGFAVSAIATVVSVTVVRFAGRRLASFLRD